MKREEKVVEYLKYTFGDEELLELSKIMAKKDQERAQLEEDKKRIVADLKSKGETLESEISNLSRKIYSGFEFRNVDCLVNYHTPNIGWKTIVRLDTGEEVKSLAMSTSEMQEILPFKDSDNGTQPTA